MSKQEKTIIILDGNAIIHRSFHALPTTMKTKDGLTTNAIFGFASFLLKTIKEFKPDYIALTLDRKEKTFRHKQYKEYKATRQKAPDELYEQIPEIKKLAENFNIPIFEKAGFEADDLIGSIAVKLTDENLKKIIVTGDMDTLQLADDKKNIKIYAMSRGISEARLFDEKAIKEKYSLRPNQIIDYKALRGDPSDNIPGVAGVGEKTAVELLKNFNSLDEIYKNINSDKIKDSVREKLKKDKEKAYLSQKLATIDTSVDINPDLGELEFKEINTEKTIKNFSRLQFKSLIPRLKEITKNSEGENIDKFARNRKEFKYHLIEKEEDFQKFLVELKKQKEFTFDTETSGFDPLTSDLLGISFAWQEGEAYYVFINRKNRKANQENNSLFNYQKKEDKNNGFLEKLKEIFEDASIKKSAHNIKFDWRVLLAHGVNLAGADFDTMIASYLLAPGSRQHNLDALVFSELGFEKISKEDLLGKGQKKKKFFEIKTEKLSLYSCEDADFTHRLIDGLEKKLKEKEQIELFQEIEMPLVEVLIAMEEAGVRINKKVLAGLKKETREKIKNLEEKIHDLAGKTFNINSTQQLKEVLFEKLEIPTYGIKKGKTGFSTASDELKKLENEHKIIPLIQNHRELRKMLTTYIDALPELINRNTGRLHSSFNQTVTATGRLSSTNPNLQNIPTKSELGKKIRKAFEAEPGFELLSLDYSQIELRLAAHISGDEKMKKAFAEGADIHTATAAEINEVPLREATKQMRREAKAINFGVLYGQGPHGLSQTADIPYMRAKEFIDEYFAKFSGIKKYIDSQIQKTKETGYAETLFGRRRYLADINSSTPMIRKQAERAAVNTPLQGTAADIIKIAMIEVHKMIKKDKKENDIKMLIQVHDELIFEIKKDLVKEYTQKIKEKMEKISGLDLDLTVDAKTGRNWGKMEKLKN